MIYYQSSSVWRTKHSAYGYLTLPVNSRIAPGLHLRVMGVCSFRLPGARGIF